MTTPVAEPIRTPITRGDRSLLHPGSAMSVDVDRYGAALHLAERYGFDAEAVLSEARDSATTERIDQH